MTLSNKRFLVALTKEQLDGLVELTDVLDKSESGPDYAVFNRVLQESNNTPPILFVSTYTEKNNYGGPEEGGWYYTNTYLVGTQCFVCDGFIADMDDVYAAFAEQMCQEQKDSTPMSDVIKNLDELGGFIVPDAECPEVFFAVETAPGMFCDTVRHHYE